jgi:hypothetical protein
MEYTLWESQCEHDHKAKSTKRLPPQSVEIVKQCINDNIKSTKMIINKLKKLQLPQLKEHQINNLKSRLKENNLGKTKVDLNDLVEWCNNRLETPENPDEVFCGGIYYEISEKKTKITEKDCKKYFTEKQKAEWKSYDDYLSFISKGLKLVQINDENWELSQCNCYIWCKTYKCKHTLAMCERKGYFKYPLQARQIEVGKNRKRGRPRLTKSALRFQDEDEEYVYSSTDSEEEKVATKRGRKRKLKEQLDSDEDDFDLLKDDSTNALSELDDSVEPAPTTSKSNKKQKKKKSPFKNSTPKDIAKTKSNNLLSSKISTINQPPYNQRITRSAAANLKK